MTFTLLQQPTASSETVTLSLAPDASQLSSAIGSFVTAYNAMNTQVQQQVGSSGGLLSGDYAVRAIQSDLESMVSYFSPTGSIQSLAGVGVTFDDTTGALSFNQDAVTANDPVAFNNLTASQLQGAMQFFGSLTNGFCAVSQTLNSLTDPVSGIIQTEQNGFSQTDTNLKAQISTMTDQINTMQTNLSQQLAAADTLIAGLQSQQNMLSSSIDALNYSTYGVITSSNAA
jgi:flagellar hook-associated protein 2